MKEIRIKRPTITFKEPVVKKKGEEETPRTPIKNPRNIAQLLDKSKRT